MTEIKDTDVRLAQVIFFLWLAGVFSLPFFRIFDLDMQYLWGGTSQMGKSHLVFCLTSMVVPFAFNWIKFGRLMLFPKAQTDPNSKPESGAKEFNVFGDDKRTTLEIDETDPSEALAKLKRLKK